MSTFGVLHQGLEPRLEVVEVLQISYAHPVTDDLGRVRRPDALEKFDIPPGVFHGKVGTQHNSRGRDFLIGWLRTMIRSLYRSEG